MTNHPNRSRLKVREVTRTCASPKPGMSQEWTEYQVVKGRNVLSRHDLMSDAIAAMERHAAESE